MASVARSGAHALRGSPGRKAGQRARQPSQAASAHTSSASMPSPPWFTASCSTTAPGSGAVSRFSSSQWRRASLLAVLESCSSNGDGCGAVPSMLRRRVPAAQGHLLRESARQALRRRNRGAGLEDRGSRLATSAAPVEPVWRGFLRTTKAGTTLRAAPAYVVRAAVRSLPQRPLALPQACNRRSRKTLPTRACHWLRSRGSKARAAFCGSPADCGDACCAHGGLRCARRHASAAASECITCTVAPYRRRAAATRRSRSEGRVAAFSHVCCWLSPDCPLRLFCSCSGRGDICGRQRARPHAAVLRPAVPVSGDV